MRHFSMQQTSGVAPRESQKMELALRHSCAVVVAFSLPLRPKHERLAVSSPLRSIKATAQHILNRSVFDAAEARVPASRDDMAASAVAETTGRRVIGFARAYSDGAFSAMITDVAIEEKYKSNDVGKKLLAVLIETLKSKGIGSYAAMVSKMSHDYLYHCGFRETYLRALRYNPLTSSSPHGLPRPESDRIHSVGKSVHHV